MALFTEQDFATFANYKPGQSDPETTPGAPAPVAGAAPSGNVASFVRQYGPTADRVAQRLGVTPDVLLGQWGLETGWGKSVIPGTNNLGNIKDFSGRGVAATDNMTGSRDNYRAYDSGDAFGDDYASLIERRYQGATGAGGDARRYAEALQRGGYAEDPDYISKMERAANMVRGVTGAAYQPIAPSPQSRSPWDAAPNLVSSGALEADWQAAQPEGAGPTFGDYGKTFGASILRGTGDLARGLVLEPLAWAANAITGTEDYKGFNPLEGASDWIRDTMTEGGKAAAQDLPSGDLFDPSTWQMPDTLAGTFMMMADGFGSLFPSMLPAAWPAVGAKRLYDAANVAQKAGDAVKAAALLKQANRARSLAGKVGAASGFGTAGGASAGEARRGVTESMAEMTHEEMLATVPIYREAFEKFGTEEDARSAVENTAGQLANVFGGVVGGSGGVINAKLLTDYLAKRGIMAALHGVSNNWAVRGAVGAGVGGLTEAGQEATEGIGTNVAENIALGRPTLEDADRDTFPDALGGALVGGPVGGVGGATSRAPGRDEPPAPVAPQPNSPLTNAANAIAATQAQTPNLPATTEQPSEFDMRLDRVRSFVEDREFIQGLRGSEAFGAESVTELLSAYAKARNPNIDDVVRNKAMDDIEQFLDAFANRPNFTFGQQAQGSQPEQASQLRDPTKMLEGPDFNERDITPQPVGGDRMLETDAALQAKRDADAAYEQAFADLVKAEELGQSDVDLQAYQQALTEAKQQRIDMDAQLDKIQRAIEEGRAQQSIGSRAAVLSQILADPQTVNPKERFEAELKRQGFRDPTANEVELDAIAQVAQQVATQAADKQALIAPIPSPPNEMQPYAAPRQTQAPAQPSRDRAGEIRDLISNGWRIQNRTLVGPRGQKRNLNAVEFAAAREAVRQQSQETSSGAKTDQAEQTKSAATQEKPARSGQSPFASTNKFAVETEDNGGFDVTVHRTKDGGVVILTPDGVMEYNGDFARDKSDTDMLAYVFEPLGFQQATQAEQVGQEAQAQPAQPITTGKSAEIAGNNSQQGRGVQPQPPVSLPVSNEATAGKSGETQSPIAPVGQYSPADAGTAAIHNAVAAAEAATDTSPSDAKKSAGNYAKGKVSLHGQTIAIETPKGAERSGKDASGRRWSITMPVSYGYFLNTLANDGDHVDVFIGPKPEAGLYWVVNQVKPDSIKFDEPKVMLGFESAESARDAYIGSFSSGFGPKVFGNMVGPLSVTELGAMLPKMERSRPTTGNVAVAGRLFESEAPEHAAVGVDDGELADIVKEFSDVSASMLSGDDQIHHLFDAPAKSDIVRLADKAKVYHKDHGWMTPAEARAVIAQWKDHAASQGDIRGAGGNGDKVVLSLFDYTGKWSQPWEDAGYQVFRFDIQQDPEVGDVNSFSTEFFGDWFGDFEGMDIHAILAACPCTDFASSGARHFAAKDQDGRTVASVRLIQQTLATIEHFRPAVWAVENPVGRIERLGGLPPWRLSFDPNHLGDPYTKKTLLWGRFNADMPVLPVEPTEGSKMHSQYGGKSLATKNARSATPEGFSYGFFMANNAIDHPAMALAGKFDRLDRALIEEAIAAGVTPADITSAVEDFYYMDLDDGAANQAIRDLIPATTSTRDQILAIASEWDTLGDADMAKAVRAGVSGREPTQQNLDFQRQKIESEKAKRAGTAAATPETYTLDGTLALDEDVREQKILDDFKRTSNSAALDLYSRADDAIKAALSVLNQQGYTFGGIDARSPTNVSRVKGELSGVAGAVSRMMKRQVTLDRGYKRGSASEVAKASKGVTEAIDLLSKAVDAIKPAQQEPATNLSLSTDGIIGREVPADQVPNGNGAFQYAIGRTEEGGTEAIYRRRADERGTYGGWRWEADAGKLSDARPAGYVAPPKLKGVHSSWDGVWKSGTTPNQDLMLAAVQKAKDAGLFYTAEIGDFVARELGVTDAQRAVDAHLVQGGAFGMDAYLAGKELDRRSTWQGNIDAVDRLGLVPGKVLGTLIFSDFKQTRAVEVVSVAEDKQSVDVKGMRGRAAVTGTMAPNSIQYAIERAEEKGARKPAETQATDTAPAQSEQQQFVASRTDEQLRYLSTSGKPGVKEAATAELARRNPSEGAAETEVVESSARPAGAMQPITSKPFAQIEEGKTALVIEGDPAELKSRLDAAGIKSVPRKSGVSVPNKKQWDLARQTIPVSIETHRVEGVPERLADVTIEVMSSGAVRLESPAGTENHPNTQTALKSYAEGHKDSPESVPAAPVVAIPPPKAAKGLKPPKKAVVDVKTAEKELRRYFAATLDADNGPRLGLTASGRDVRIELSGRSHTNYSTSTTYIELKDGQWAVNNALQTPPKNEYEREYMGEIRASVAWLNAPEPAKRSALDEVAERVPNTAWADALDSAWNDGFETGNATFVASLQSVEDRYGPVTDDQLHEYNMAYRGGAEESISSEKGAVHKDPGQPAEAVTQPVIQQALRTSAKNTNFDPVQAKKWLMGEIDQAIAAVEEGKADLVAEMAKERLLTFNENSVKTLSPAKRTEARDEFNALRDDRIAKIAKQIGFVTFDVPGDGKFKVVNSVENLTAFKKKVNSTPGFSKNPTRPLGSGSGMAGAVSLDAEIERIKRMTADEKRYFGGDVLEEIGNAIEVARLKDGKGEDALLDRFKENSGGKDYDAWRAEREAEESIAGREESEGSAGSDVLAMFAQEIPDFKSTRDEVLSAYGNASFSFNSKPYSSGADTQHKGRLEARLGDAGLTAREAKAVIADALTIKAQETRGQGPMTFLQSKYVVRAAANQGLIAPVDIEGVSVQAQTPEPRTEYPFGRVEREDQFFRSRVRVLPSLRGETAWEGAVGSVLNGGRLIEVTRDGQDFSVRIGGDRIEVLDRVEQSEQAQAAPVPDVTPQAQGRPDTGRYVQPKGDGSVEQQKAMAGRGGRIASLLSVNEMAGGLYTRSEIESVANDRIDIVRDWLIEQSRASESRMKAELAKVPDGVQTRLSNALSSLRSIRDRLANVESARGKGHMLALEVRDVQEDVARYQATLNDFRKRAPDNDVDAELVIRALQGEPDLSVFGEPAADESSQGAAEQAAWDMTSAEFAQDALDRNEYKPAYEDNPKLKAEYLRDQAPLWRRAVEKAGEDRVLSDRVLDDYVAQFGEQALHQAFRGVSEMGASQWEPSDVRVWDKTYKQYLAHHAGLTVKGDKKDAHRTAVKRALEQGKDVPAKVLADYPELSAQGETGVAEVATNPERGAEPPHYAEQRARARSYWTETVMPAVHGYLDAFSDFGVGRLERNRVKPEGMSARDWLQSFQNMSSTWEKGRKTSQTGIQYLGKKDLWPTDDGAGERLRKSMLAAIKALRGAPMTSSDMLAEAFMEDSAAPAETPAETSTGNQPTLTGPRRDPTQVNIFNPYQAGNVVTIDGKDWQVRADMPGWYLTDTGDWRGKHPTIQRISAMNDLIREVEQAAQKQSDGESQSGEVSDPSYDRQDEIGEWISAFAPVKGWGAGDGSIAYGEYLLQYPVPDISEAKFVSLFDERIYDRAQTSDRITADQARKLMAWTDMGQRDNVKRMAVQFFENVEDLKAGRGGMNYGTIESYQGGKWNIDGTAYPTLKAAKAEAVERAIDRLRTDGYVQAEALTAASVATPTATADPDTATAVTAQPEQAPNDGVIPDKIGESLAGGRASREALQAMTTDLTDDQIASMPLSKIWPADEIGKIDDTFAAAVSHAARAEIPAKPRTAYKVARWVKTVKMYRQVVSRLLNSTDRDTLIGMFKGYGSTLDGFASKVTLLESIDRDSWGRIGKVGEYPEATRVEGGERFPSPFVQVEIDGRTNLFGGSSSIADVVESVMGKLAGETGGKKLAFEVRGRTGRYFINKTGDKEYRPLKVFTTAKEAQAYRSDNYDDLVAAWEDVKARDNVSKADVRRGENRTRQGKDWRKDKDVTGDDFLTDFRFKGVEFGKWVNQGEGAKERQGMLNQAYDALMDLADILNMPPQALSLNGSMGLAFGSRGSGAASAHFEPGNIVINLTKTRGAGTLAHEWFHSLDNYFARQRGGEVPMRRGENAATAYRRGNYITYQPEPQYVHVAYPDYVMSKAQLNRQRAQSPGSRQFREDAWILDPRHPEGVRPVVEGSFAELVEALDASPMAARAAKNDKSPTDGYWSRIIERGARSFENYVITKMQQQGYHNDYLVNVRAVEEFGRDPARYPYLLEEEIAPVAEAFDNLFGAIETKETDQGIALFRATNTVPEGLGGVVSLPDAQSVIKAFVEANPGSPEFVLVQSFESLPEAIQQGALEQGHTKGGTRGIYKNGKVYLISDNHISIPEFESTVFHEALGHFGLRALLGPDFAQKLNQLYVGLGGQGGLVRIMNARGMGDVLQMYIRGVQQAQQADSAALREARQKGDKKRTLQWTEAMSQLVLTEEVLAHIAEQQSRPVLMDRIKALIGKLRQWLRDNGFMKLAEMGETDLLHILDMARGKMRGPSGDGGPRGGVRDASVPSVQSFAGARARTADTRALASAQARLEAGESAEAVRQETGWLQSPGDGKWKFEINDSDASAQYPGDFKESVMAAYRDGFDLSGQQAYKVVLTDVLRHPALFAAYPQIKNIEVQILSKSGRTRGRMETGTIDGVPFDPVLKIREDLPASEWLSVMLHEVQHSIQRIEDFAKGGSPALAPNAGTSASVDARRQEIEAKKADARQRLGQVVQSLFGTDNWLDAAKMNDVPADDLDAWGAESFGEPFITWRRAERMLRDIPTAAKLDELRAMEWYSRLAGEVEARNTQARQGMTEAERRATPPSATSDVADADVIVVFNGTEMDSAPTPANAGVDEAAAQQFRATEQAYGGRVAFDRARAEGKTKLNYRQWVQVRTPNFKRFFGDWEAGAGAQKIASAAAMNLDGLQPLADKKGIEDAFRNFSPAENIIDGRIVTFPVNMAGKIDRHRGFDVKRVAGAFDRLFASAVPMTSDVEQVKEGHKNHTRNFEAYHHYVSKFEQGGKTYYVRFTLQRLKAKPGNTGPSIAHSSFVSEVAVYEQGATPESASVRVIDPVLAEGAAPLDSKLAQWLADGNPDTVSKVTDPETGEPLVVYHGTRTKGEAIKSFDLDKAGSKTDHGYMGRGFYFGDSRTAGVYAGHYEFDPGHFPQGGVVYPVYLALKNPVLLRDRKENGRSVDLEVLARETAGLPKSASSEELRAKLEDMGHDGAIYTVGDTPSSYREYVAFSPTQIKSSTGNNGNFDRTKDDIQQRRTADQTTDGLTPDAFRAALVERFGEQGVAALEAQGLLNVVDAESAQPGNPAWYESGKAFFVPQFHKDASEAIASVLHEVGTHYGLEGMLGERGWRTLKARIARLAAEGNPDIRAVWDGVLDNYSEFDGQSESSLIESDQFMHEVIAKLGERAAGRKSSIWRDMLAAVNRFLLKMGVGRQINKNEVADLVEGSLKRVMGGQVQGGTSQQGRMDARSAQGGLSAWLQEYASRNDAFVHGRNELMSSKDISDLVEAFSDDAVTISLVSNDGVIMLSASGSDGARSSMIMRQNTDGTYSINATTANPLGLSGRSGMRLYQAMFAYAANNGLKVTPESRLTPINKLRRTSAMLSAALRAGTTDFTTPHPDQKVVGWKDGDFAGNVAALAEAEARMVAERISLFDNLYIDPETGQIYANNEALPSDADQQSTRVDQDADDVSRGRRETAGRVDSEPPGMAGAQGGLYGQARTQARATVAEGMDADSDGAGQGGARRSDGDRPGDGPARAGDSAGARTGSQSKRSGRAISDAELESYLASTGAGRGGINGHGVGLTTLKRALFARAAKEGGAQTAPSGLMYRISFNPADYMPGRGAALTETERKNQLLREQHKSIWDKARTWLKRQLTPGGLLPDSVFKEKIQRDSEFEVIEFDVRHMVGQLEAAIKADYGIDAVKLETETQRLLQAALAGDIDPTIPEQTRVVLLGMRQYIDGLSEQYIAALQMQMEGLAADFSDAERVLFDAYLAAGEIFAADDTPAAKGAATRKRNRVMDEAKAQAKELMGGNGSGIQAALGRVADAAERAGLIRTITSNMGEYVHRSYRAFDDPNWYKSVPDGVLDDARAYLTERFSESMDPEDATSRAEVVIHEILKYNTAYGGIEGFIKESKLGAKDLSVLKKRKQIAPEIKALLGEHVDPRVNFAKSATKMGRLIWNQSFLERVLDLGMGNFLWTNDTKPPEATSKIAADGSEAYAPLNGLWTTPEIDQAFKDALGKEQMADWFRFVVKMNGVVKYGKTVLSPTTAARNWMSAFFFSVANGHFDMRHMKKSVDGLREYFLHAGDAGKLAYLRELKHLGVVYDTPYAGEMMRLLDDSELVNGWDQSGGKTKQSIKKALALATKFYQYGDDFWKIIGFENEKRAWIEAGLSEQEAKVKAAERVRNTYPTYSMVGRGIQSLRRFPLAGTFVSFPSEIIRTGYNMVRYMAEDFKHPERRKMAVRRAVGLSIVSSMAFAAQKLSMLMLGFDDDDDEAVRQMAAPWQKNSSFIFTGRDEKGHIRYLDVSFLDPYNYWKRPIMAVLRGQPVDDAIKSAIGEITGPFFGTDIAAGSIFEVLANAKSSGAQVYRDHDPAFDQFLSIANHLRKALQPGIAANMERTWKALDGTASPSGKVYNIEDELAAWVGFRMSTLDPKVALFYRSFEFKDAKADAERRLRDVIRNPKDVSDSKIESAHGAMIRMRENAYSQMITLVDAARKSGMNNAELSAALRDAGVSAVDAGAIVRGVTPGWRPSATTVANTARKVTNTFGPEAGREVRVRYRDAAALEQ